MFHSTVSQFHSFDSFTVSLCDASLLRATAARTRRRSAGLLAHADVRVLSKPTAPSSFAAAFAQAGAASPLYTQAAATVTFAQAAADHRGSSLTGNKSKAATAFK